MLQLIPEKQGSQEQATFISAQPRASYPEGRCCNKSVYTKVLQLGEDRSVFSSKPKEAGFGAELGPLL